MTTDTLMGVLDEVRSSLSDLEVVQQSLDRQVAAQKLRAAEILRAYGAARDVTEPPDKDVCHLYWRSELAVADIAAAAGISNVSEVFMFAGPPPTLSRPCPQCGSAMTHVPKNRSDMHFTRRMTCHPCGTANREGHDRREADIRARRDAARRTDPVYAELEQRVVALRQQGSHMDSEAMQIQQEMAARLVGVSMWEV